MIPQKGQRVKCAMRNNIVIDGIVESWSDSQSILRSLDGTSISIIQHTAQDIVVIKILLKEPTKIKSELEKQFEEVQKSPSDNELRIKDMAELKTMMAEQERRIVSEKIKDHRVVDDVKRVMYGQPGFFKKSSTK